MKRFAWIPISLLVPLMLPITGCETKAEMRRQQELERLREEVGQARDGRADIADTVEEIKAEIARVGNAAEARAQQSSQQLEAMQKDIAALTTRVQAIEQRAVAEAMQPKPPPPPPPVERKLGYEDGKRLFDDGKYEDAIEALKPLAKVKGRSEEKAKAQFLLAESYFGNRDYASAALTYAEFEKMNPKDPQVPNAIYGQGKAFKNMGKMKEAKLFYQEVIERYPKSKVAMKARKEIKHLK